MIVNVRTVRCENNYFAVHCDGDVVAGVQCAMTIGSIRKVGHRFFATNASGTKALGLFYSMDDAVNKIVEVAKLEGK
jgi:hypothetical protein